MINNYFSPFPTHSFSEPENLSNFNIFLKKQILILNEYKCIFKIFHCCFIAHLSKKINISQVPSTPKRALGFVVTVAMVKEVH